MGELDRETQLYGLATPSGRVTTTGVGGFTLGGGYGWLSPRFGLACDNLLSADVVTADGRLVTASEDANDDLLWGLRGGGGNFGVVTSYEFHLHPVGPTVLAGLLVHPIEEAPSLLRAVRDYVESAPTELVTATGILQAPPAEFIPPRLHGKPVLGVFVLYIGDPSEGRAVIAPLKELGPPAADLVGPMPYTAFQAMIDPFAPRGMLNYHRGIHLSALPDEAVDAYVDLGTEIALVSSPTTQAILFRHGGAVSRVADDATAAGHRDAAYMAHPIVAWQDPAQTELHLDWVRRFSAAMAPFSTGGCLPELRARRGRGAGPRRLRRRQVPEAGGAEGQVGPRQPVPGQPEHQAEPRTGVRARVTHGACRASSRPLARRSMWPWTPRTGRARWARPSTTPWPTWRACPTDP